MILLISLIQLFLKLDLCIFQPSLGYRNFWYDFNYSNTNFTCPEYHRYQPDLIPHTCVGYVPICLGVTEVTVKKQNNQEVLCHPRFQAFNLMPISFSNYTVRCNPYDTLTLSYNENGEVIYTCQINNYYCVLAQKYNEVFKCQYCDIILYGEYCAELKPGISAYTWNRCPKNCLHCFSLTYCYVCWEGYSQLNYTDLVCSLECKQGDASCSYDAVTKIYTTLSCRVGYETTIVDYKIVCRKCTDYCGYCYLGVCMYCIKNYQLLKGKCFGDPNCMKHSIVYNSNNSPTGIHCFQCDFGYFNNGSLCQFCQTVPGLETCFLCNSAKECKTCQARYYLNNEKKCVPFDGCDVRCNTCLTTNPKFCTTCDYINLKRVSTGDGNCVCAQGQNYAEKYGSCVLCTEGFCNTCTLNFFECTSCDSGRNRILVDKSCVCLQGYYETDLDDKKCLKCDQTCYNCDGPDNNNCIIIINSIYQYGM